MEREYLCYRFKQTINFFRCMEYVLILNSLLLDDLLVDEVKPLATCVSSQNFKEIKSHRDWALLAFLIRLSETWCNKEVNEFTSRAKERWLNAGHSTSVIQL